MKGFSHSAGQNTRQLLDAKYLFEVLAEVAEGKAEPVIAEHDTCPGYFKVPSNRKMFAYAVLEAMELIGFVDNVRVGQTYHITGWGRNIYDRLRVPDSFSVSAPLADNPSVITR